MVSICGFLQEPEQIVGCVPHGGGGCAAAALAPVWEWGELAVTELVVLWGLSGDIWRNAS